MYGNARMPLPHGIWIVATSLLVVAACTSGPGDTPGDRRFVAVGAAVARDARTGLEWTRHDDGAGLDWHKAEAYCRSLSVDDGGGWRLPDIAELRSLYDTTTSSPCGVATCAIDPIFTLTSAYVWSATAEGPKARTYLDFQFGTELSPGIFPQLVRRVLCVRTSSAARPAS
jgi:hypothetical protein